MLPAARTEEGSASKPDNLLTFIDEFDKRVRADDKPPNDAAPEQPAAPAASATPPAPEAPSTDDDPTEEWWEKGITAKHKFLNGRKGEEVERMFRSAEEKIQASGIRANQLDARLRELEAERAAWRVSNQAPSAADGGDKPPAKEAGEDPRMEQVRDQWYSNLPEAMKLWRDVLNDDFRKQIETREAETAHQQLLLTAQSAGELAIKSLATKYKRSEKEIRALAAQSLKHIKKHVEDTGDDSVWTRFENYEIAFETEYGPPPEQAPEIPPPLAAQADPPHAMRSAPPPPRKPAIKSALSEAEQRDREALAKHIKMTPAATDRFLQRS